MMSAPDHVESLGREVPEDGEGGWDAPPHVAGASELEGFYHFGNSA
jgi:hypothetical protein